MSWPTENADVFSYAYFGCASLIKHAELPIAVAGDIDIFLELPAQQHSLTSENLEILGVAPGERLAWMAVRKSKIGPGKGLFALREFGFMPNKIAERIGYYAGEVMDKVDDEDVVVKLKPGNFVAVNHPWKFKPGMFAWLAQKCDKKNTENTRLLENRGIYVTRKIQLFEEIILDTKVSGLGKKPTKAPPAKEEPKKAPAPKKEQPKEQALFLKAALTGDVQKLQKFIDNNHGIVDVADENGKTALMLAAAAGNGEVVQVLLQARANRALLDNMGNNAIDLALQSKNQGVVNKFFGSTDKCSFMHIDVYLKQLLENTDTFLDIYVEHHPPWISSLKTNFGWEGTYMKRVHDALAPCIRTPRAPWCGQGGRVHGIDVRHDPARGLTLPNISELIRQLRLKTLYPAENSNILGMYPEWRTIASKLKNQSVEQYVAVLREESKIPKFEEQILKKSRKSPDFELLRGELDKVQQKYITTWHSVVNNIVSKEHENLTDDETLRMTRFLETISMYYMDLYLLTRMFRKFEDASHKEAKNIVIYCGLSHAEVYLQVFVALGFTVTGHVKCGAVTRCLDMSAFTQPFFDKNKRTHMGENPAAPSKSARRKPVAEFLSGPCLLYSLESSEYDKTVYIFGEYHGEMASCADYDCVPAPA